MVRYGLSPYEALLTATRFPGEFLGEPLGTITQGALADLLLVEGDPLAHIEDAAAVRAVLRNGEYFTVEELMKPLAGVSADPAGRRLSSTVAASTGTCSRFWWHGSDYVEPSRGACCANHFFATTSPASGNS